MERVQQLIIFGKEYLAEKSLDGLNESVIWALKEATDLAIEQLRTDTDSFWDSFQVPNSLKSRYLKMHKECKALLAKLSKSGPKGGVRSRQTHLFSISDDEEDSFDNPRVCFDNMKSLLLDLEIEYNHYAKLKSETQFKSLVGSKDDELVRFPVVVFNDFSDSFSKLSRLFKMQAQQGNLKSSSEELNLAKTLITECQKDAVLLYVWNLIRDTNRILKILGKTLQACRALYGDKLVQPESSQRRKESCSEKMSFFMNRPINSFKMSMNISKIRVRPSMKVNDSFANDVNDFFYSDDMSLVTRQGETRLLNLKRIPPPSPQKRPSFPGQKMTIRRLPDDGAFGRCYCDVF